MWYNKKRAFGRLIVLGFLFMLVVGCAPAATPAAPTKAPQPAVATQPPAAQQPSISGEIRLGEINALTGVQATQGVPVHEGIQYAIDDLNAKGGLKGRKIVLITRDDESKPERALAAAEELTTKENVVALIGGYNDTLVGPVSEVAERQKVPYLAAASLDKRLVQRGYKFFFRLANLDGFVNATQSAIIDAFKASNVAILYSATPGATQTAEKLRDTLAQKGVKVSVFEKFTPGMSDFVPLLNKVREAGAQVIVSAGFTGDNVLMVRQLKEQKINIGAFLSLYGASLRAPIYQLGDAADFTSNTAIWSPQLNLTTPGTEEESKTFAAGFKGKFNKEADGLTMHGYSAARTLLTAMEQVLDAGQPLTPQNIRDKLSGLDLKTPLLRVKFDETGESQYYQLVVTQLQGDKVVIIAPPDRATGKAVFPMPEWDKR